MDIRKELENLEDVIAQMKFEAGISVDAVEMNRSIFLKIKEAATVYKHSYGDPRAHMLPPIVMNYILNGLTIFINDDVETGIINVGKCSSFMKKNKYEAIFNRLNEICK